MGSALVPFNTAPTATYVTATFDAWASNGWTEQNVGDVGTPWGANGAFAVSDLASSPPTRSTELVKTFTAADGLPLNALVTVRLGLQWSLGTGCPGGPSPVTGLFFGASANGVQGALPGPITFDPVPRYITMLVRTTSTGDLEVRVGATGLVGSFDIQAQFASIEMTSVGGEFADIIIDSAVLIVNGMQLTISRGGWSFDPGEEWEDFPFPGRTMNTRGARELVRLKPIIRGNAMMAGEIQISAYRPDGLWSDHATIAGARTFTPNALRAYLTDYLEHVFLVWKRLRGDYLAVEFPVATCGGYSLGAVDADEGLFPLIIEAVQDLATGTTKTAIPYRIHTLPATTEVSDLPAGSDS